MKLTKDQKRKKKLKLRAREQNLRIAANINLLKFYRDAPEHVANPAMFKTILNNRSVIKHLKTDKAFEGQQESKVDKIEMNTSEETKELILKASSKNEA